MGPFLMTSIFGDQPYFFLKAPLTPIQNNFEGKKTRLFGQQILKSAKYSILTNFSTNCLRHRKICVNRVGIVFWERSENQFRRHKIMPTTILIFL